MDDVWFGQGASQADVDACLTALALQGKPRPPLLAVAAGADSPRLILASRALFELFDVTSGEALLERLTGGHDPGSRRLGALCQTLALDGAPRLERLRFFMGRGTEIITFLCRRVPIEGEPRFIAAALGVVPTEAVQPTAAQPDVESAPVDAVTGQAAAAASTQPMGIQDILATLRGRWPSNRTLRFLWQCDAAMICTYMASPLADVVGPINANVVGRDLMTVASMVDPSGKFATALASKTTFSGVPVDWPITDTPAAVRVAFGAIPSVDRERGFDGYRGYGVIALDQVTKHDEMNLAAVPPRDAPASTPDVTRASEAEPAKREDVAAPVRPANVVRFPRSRTLSPEEQESFTTLGAELREETGLVEAGPLPLEPPRQPASAGASPAEAPVAADLGDKRAAEIGRHALSILDKLAVGLLVSRDNVPIFANRNLLDTLGFANEDALHEIGGMTHLFGGQPGNVSGSEAVGIRHRDGRILSKNARMQTIEWDGLPATLLTLQSALPQAPSAQAPSEAIATVPLETAVVSAPPHGEDAEARELRAILETAADGVVVIDGEGNVTSVNRSAEALLGRDRSAVIGKPYLDLFAADNQSLAADYLDGLKSDATKRLLNDGREFLIKADQGQTIPVFMTLGRLSGADDANPRFCALFRDVTHWKKVEAELENAKQDAERANALKSDFLAKVSHEVRTPLNAIIGFADVMMEERFGPVGSERYKEYLRDIHASGTHVMSLVNDLLDLSKIEAGKMELKSETIDPNKIISECVAIMQPQASTARVIMRLSLAPALPQIKADERSLRQIVLNLLSNAVKFNEPGGQVIVATTTPESGHVVIRVRDTGPGMSEADISAALEPFRQLPTARPANGGGTGLGLPLTKALVEANQASFSIRSKVDQGTLVEVSFPPARVLAR